jgi:hypothetical protein
MISRYLGGKTELKLSEDEFQYNSKKWYEVWKTSDWKDVGAHEAEIDGIKVGLIEYIYLSEETGDEDNDEIIRSNYGMLCSRGTATDTSWMETLTKGLQRTPDASAFDGTTVF